MISETSSVAQNEAGVPTGSAAVASAPYAKIGRDPRVCDAKGNPHTFIAFKSEFVCVDCGAIFEGDE